MAQGAVCTQACIDASARLCADIAHRYGWDHLWHDGTRGNIWLHREIPGTDHAGCPDLAPNGLPYQQVIDKANAILKGENMSVAEVTEGLYQAKGNDGRNIFDSVIQTRNELKDRAADASTQPRATTRNLFDGVIQARWDIAELKTMLTAQTAAIEAAQPSHGRRPRPDRGSCQARRSRQARQLAHHHQSRGLACNPDGRRGFSQTASGIAT